MKYGNSEPAQRLRNYINKLFFSMEMAEEMGYFISANAATDIGVGYVTDTDSYEKVEGPLQIPRNEESAFLDQL